MSYKALAVITKKYSETSSEDFFQATVSTDSFSMWTGPTYIHIYMQSSR